MWFVQTSWWLLWTVSARLSRPTTGVICTTVPVLCSPGLSDYSMLLVFVLVAFCWTKSLLCNVADFTGMPYQFRVFKYSEFISLIWKGPYYDKITVASVKKEFPDSKKTLQSLQLSKSWIPILSSEWPSETPRHSSVSNINNDAFNQGFCKFSEVFFIDMFLEDSMGISRQCCQIPCIRLGDVVFRHDAH